MLRKLGAAIYRGLFWTYERGTWQYDIMVALILGFIFLTPRGWFRDQPNLPETSGVVLVSSNDHEKVYQLRAAVLQLKQEAKAEEAIRKGAERVLQSYTGKPVQITRIQPEMDKRGEVVSYAVWVQD
jgi:hypothetical protein